MEDYSDYDDFCNAASWFIAVFILAFIVSLALMLSEQDTKYITPKETTNGLGNNRPHQK